VRRGGRRRPLRPARRRARRRPPRPPRAPARGARATRQPEPPRARPRPPLASLPRLQRLVDVVVMAAGEGRRMRPISERWPKPVLPIDGRPVIGTLLRTVAEAGVERATVVTGHLAEQVEALVGDGAAFGLAVSSVHQPEPLGSADAMLPAAA